MKKYTVIIISLFLCLSLLCGCARPATVEEAELEDTPAAETAAVPTDELTIEIPVAELGKFSELEYARPDVEAMNAKAEELYDALENPLKAVQVKELLQEFYNLYYDYDTMFTLAYIRSCHDVSDSFYSEEYSWLSQRDAELQMLVESVYTACANSVHASWLEEFLFWPGFRDEYAADYETLADEDYERYLSLAEEEARILGEYRQMIASPTVEVNGQEWNYDEYMLSLGGYDESAFWLYYDKYNPLLAEIYIELIQNRQEQAELLGYSSYPEMAYEIFYSRDYSVEESESFIEKVKTQLSYLGAGYIDGLFYIGSGITVPGDRELALMLETAAEGLGGSIEQAYKFMLTHELCDLEQSPDKAEISFVTNLSLYEVPYLFICPFGTQDDIITVFHEFGHYADNYIRGGMEESIDLSESFSQAMQLLSPSHLENVLSPEELEELRRMNLLDLLDAYLQQTALAEFELRAYEMEEPSLEKLNQLCLDITKEYGLYDEFGGDYNSFYWVDVRHLFESPFYVISYPVSASLALELYEMELEQEGAGSEKFVEMSECGYAGLMETADYAGLSDPMSEERILAAAKLFDTIFNQ